MKRTMIATLAAVGAVLAAAYLTGADGTPAQLKAMDPSGRLDVVFRNLTKGAAQ